MDARWLRAALVVALVGAGCGGALDRRDGALRILLAGAPAECDAVEFALETRRRRFTGRLPRPPDDVLTSLAAVPEGPASLELVLFGGSARLGAVSGLEVVVVAGEVRELVAVFSGPARPGRVWARALGSVTRARPAVAGSSPGTVVAGDRDGRLHLLSAASGMDVHPSLDLGAPISTAVAIADDLAIVAGGDGALRAIALATGLEEWRVELGEGTATSPVFDGERIVATRGRRVVAVDHLTGRATELAELPDEILADPLADARGVVAADRAGNVLALDRAGLVVFTATVGGPVRAAPIRDLDERGVVVASELGRVVRFDREGATVGAPLELDAPIVFRPVPAGRALVVAAGPLLVFAGDGEPSTVRLAAPITGGPDVLGDGRVVVGLLSGEVAAVAADGARSTVAQVEGTALSPRALGAPSRVLVAGSTGDLALFVVEEGP